MKHGRTKKLQYLKIRKLGHAFSSFDSYQCINKQKNSDCLEIIKINGIDKWCRIVLFQNFIYLFVQINQESIAKNKNTNPHSWNPRGAGREQNLNLFGRHSWKQILLLIK
jgi:hypothetical protein